MKYLLTFATLVMAACLTPQKAEEDDENEKQEQENGAFSPSEGLWEFSTPDLEETALLRWRTPILVLKRWSK